MAEQSLNHADVVASLQEVIGKRVAENMRSNFLGDFCAADCIIERPLQIRFMEVITPTLTVFSHS